MGEGRNNFSINKCDCVKVRKEITLDINNTSAFVSAFKIHGNIEIRELYGEVIEGSITNLTELYFDSHDGTNQVLITADGSVLSGAEIGSFIAKDEDAAEVAKVSINDQVRKIESVAAKDTYQSFFLTQKFNTNTFIRLHYKTTETPIDAKVIIYIHYHKVNGGFLEIVT